MEFLNFIKLYGTIYLKQIMYQVTEGISGFEGENKFPKIL
jgi:flagellar assembly factor FliW